MENTKINKFNSSKNFDTVETFRVIKEKIAEETFHLSNEDYLAYLEKNSIAFRAEQTSKQKH